MVHDVIAGVFPEMYHNFFPQNDLPFKEQHPPLDLLEESNPQAK